MSWTSLSTESLFEKTPNLSILIPSFLLFFVLELYTTHTLLKWVIWTQHITSSMHGLNDMQAFVFILQALLDIPLVGVDLGSNPSSNMVLDLILDLLFATYKWASSQPQMCSPTSFTLQMSRPRHEGNVLWSHIY